MKFLSVCSGIEAASVAWNPLGWEAEAFSEIEPFPCQVLKHHYPNVPNMGDMTKFKEWHLGPIDLFCGGTPCQSFSVAGLRKGLDDPRGNLMLTYLAIADKFRPRWLVWENVPGVLSSNGGRDFGAFLGGLGQLGYGFAYRVLDAQYFGVAQRRRRVFVVGYLGDWRPAAAVLFERDSLCGNPAPSRKAREETSHCLTRGASQRYDSETETMIPVGVPDVMATLLSSTAGISRPGNAVTEHETYIPMTPSYGIPGNWIGRKPENGGNAVEPMHDVAPCLTKTDQHGVAQAIPIDSMNHLGRNNAEHSLGDFVPGAPSYTLTKQHSHAVAQPIAFDLAQITSKTNASRAEPGLPTGTISKGSDMHVAQPTLYSIMPMNSGKDYKAREVEVTQPLMTTPVGGNQGGDFVLQPMAYNIAPGKGKLKDDIHVTDAYATKTIDASGSNPAMHQGGAAILHPTIVHGTQDPCVSDIAFAQGRNNGGENVLVSPTLTAANDPSRSPQSSEVTQQVHAVLKASMQVRRLLPVECERLQGFPDHYTDIKPKGKPTPDGPRYKALGNSWAVPVVRWIGERIMMVEGLK